MNSENRQYIVNYLNAGGALYIESPDIGMNHDGTEMFSMFGAEYMGDGSNYEVTALNGQAGTITEDLIFTYNGGTDSHYRLDHLCSTLGSGTLLFYSSDEVGRVIASDYRGYKTIISSTILGCYSNGTGNNTKSFLMEQYLSFLDVDYIADGTICGTVLDSNSLEPIADAVVTVGEFTGVTNENGHYSFSLPEGIYQLTCQHDDYNNFTYTENVVIIPCETTDIDFEMILLVGAGEDPIPLVTALQGNFPNPFNPSTTISFELNTEITENTEIVVFNLKGQIVKILVNEKLDAGTHHVIWNGKDDNNKRVSSGVYFYKMKAGKFVSTKKMILMK